MTAPDPYVENYQEIKQQADSGNAAAMYALGRIAEHCGRPSKDSEDWFRMAAEKGHTGAIVRLGVGAHLTGQYREAGDYWRRVVELWDHRSITISERNDEEKADAAEAMFYLGLAAKESDPAEAADWFGKSADLGNIDALLNLGELAEQQGFYDEAAAWRHDAANQGHAGAMFDLGLQAWELRDLSDAANWWHKAFELASNMADVNPSINLEVLDRYHFQHGINNLLLAAKAAEMLGVVAKSSGFPIAADDWSKRALGLYRKIAASGEQSAVDILGAFIDRLFDRAFVGISAAIPAPDWLAQVVEDWYLRTASQGDIYAMRQLALFRLATGNEEEADIWHRKAALLGDKTAIKHLAWSAGNRDAKEEAVSWYRKAAEIGDVDSMMSLGSIARRDGDLDQAFEWYREAADSDEYNDATYFIFALARDGHSGAYEWCRKAADRDDCESSVLINLAELAENRGDLNEAIKWYSKVSGIRIAKLKLREFAARGHPDALEFFRGRADRAEMRVLAKRGVPEAVEWLRELAGLGDTDAMMDLGRVFYRRGALVEADEWLNKLAELGEKAAYYPLGVVAYRRGDRDQATAWYQRAVTECDSASAMTQLGWLAEQRQDLREATAWYRNAAARGDFTARNNLIRLSRLHR